MNCPNYKDFTRSCTERYPNLNKYKDFTQCESDAYQKCIIYHILQSDFNCKYIDCCLNMFHDEIPEFLKLALNNVIIYDFLASRVYDYCLTKDKNTQCARYKIKEEGTQPPPGLSPDGKNVNIKESTSKQNISFDETVIKNP